MADITTLRRKAEKLLTKNTEEPKRPDEVEIPSAPLWHMGRVALFKSQSSFQILQNAIDHLTRKAKKKAPFTGDEKEFLVELFEAMSTGGAIKAGPEAALLVNHYVNGNGKPVSLQPFAYTGSIIVRDVQKVMKHQIADDLKHMKEPILLNSTDQRLKGRAEWNAMFGHQGRSDKQGYLVDGGYLLTEQGNARLKNADHRFKLESSSSLFLFDRFVNTRWSVHSEYDFEPFDKKPGYVTHIPLAADMILKLPDGLSEYMTKLGIAKAFSYSTEWYELWDPRDSSGTDLSSQSKKPAASPKGAGKPGGQR